MTLALYRRYRPGSFSELVGQDHVTEPLRRALATGRVHHAYLFSGPRGCGKTSSARILARSLNCEKGPTPDPCGECDSCVALAPNGPGSLDVIEIDAASHNGVDDARDLRERAFFAPVSSRYKVYIVDEAHMVTTAAFNALLKVVEEPPEFVKFVFATTEPDKVVDTIRSRTFHYPFKLLSPREMQAHLASICTREGVEVDPVVLALVVRAGAGSVRDAMSVLDQLVAGSGPEGVTYERAAALLGYTDAALIDSVVDAFADRDGAAVFGAIDRVIEAGLDPRRFATDLLQRFRDLLVLGTVPDAADKGLLDVPLDGLSRMQSQVGRFGPAEVARASELLNAALVEMRGTTSPRLVLELTCARILLPAAATDETAMLSRLDRLERRVLLDPSPPSPELSERGPAIAPRGSDNSVEERPTAPAAAGVPAPPSGEGLDLAGLRQVWDSVLGAVKPRRRTTHALLSQAHVADLRDGTLVLGLDTSFLAERVLEDLNVSVLREALDEVLGVGWKVEAVVAGSGGSTRAPAAADPDPGPDPHAEESEGAAELSGVELLQAELGAKVIGEVDNT